MKHAKVKNNFSTGIRRETHDGVEHLVVPVVMIVDGVMNDALVTHEEYGKYVASWDGRPVTVYHPELHGEPIHAGRPDVASQTTLGTVFNTRVENGKLKSEAWINIEKANRLGFDGLITMLEAGVVMEVSTGYFADSDKSRGDYNGNGYSEVHRNIRPDHLALLPGEIGACSVSDGCGTRVNKKQGAMMKIEQAFNTVAQALGLRKNCNCKETNMDLIKRAEELVANKSLTAEHLEMIQSLDDEQKAMLAAVMGALGGSDEAEEMEYEEQEQEEEQMSQNKGAKPNADKPKAAPSIDVDELVANKVAEHLRRHDVTQRLVANESCAFTAAELKTMAVEHLEKYEASIRPADYSGQGGFAANSDGVDETAAPLRLNRGLAARKETK